MKMSRQSEIVHRVSAGCILIGFFTIIYGVIGFSPFMLGAGTGFIVTGSCLSTLYIDYNYYFIQNQIEEDNEETENEETEIEEVEETQLEEEVEEAEPEAELPLKEE